MEYTAYEQKSQSLKITTIMSFYIGVCVCVYVCVRVCVCGEYIVLCYLGMPYWPSELLMSQGSCLLRTRKKTNLKSMFSIWQLKYILHRAVPKENISFISGKL